VPQWEGGLRAAIRERENALKGEQAEILAARAALRKKGSAKPSTYYNV
jgi:hypothetical protein